MMPTAVKGAAELLCEYYFLNYFFKKNFTSELTRCLFQIYKL